MTRTDRLILIILALGVWALVFKPISITAHSNDDHDCTARGGSGYGELEGGGEVYVHSLNGIRVTCEHS